MYSNWLVLYHVIMIYRDEINQIKVPSPQSRSSFPQIGYPMYGDNGNSSKMPAGVKYVQSEFPRLDFHRLF
jgi:hypothetical protein